MVKISFFIFFYEPIHSNSHPKQGCLGTNKETKSEQKAKQAAT
jgi:hypothetical protein